MQHLFYATLSFVYHFVVQNGSTRVEIVKFLAHVTFKFDG